MSRLLLLAALSCSSKDPDETADPGAATLVMMSPGEDGAEYTHGDPIALEVEAQRGQHTVAATRVTWTIGDWSGSGATATASGIAVGEWTVDVEATVEGETLTASRGIEVVREGDTDTDADADTDTDADSDADTDADADADITYAGTMSAVTEYDGYAFDCPGTVNFVVSSGSFTGVGLCRIEIDTTYDIPFELVGTVGAGAIAGDLVLDADGTFYRTPFDGTGRTGNTFNARYDTTHRTSDGDIRISGTWTADPR